MSEKYLVVTSPHLKSEDNTRIIMQTVLFALIFPLGFAIIHFGVRALILSIISVASCVVFEFLYNRLLKKEQTIQDCSAMVTGLLIAFSLPVSVSLWVPVVGAFFAIVIVKMLFGGLGKNFVNPALAARAFLFNWPEQMTNWFDTSNSDGIELPLFSDINQVDMVTTATPLNLLKTGSYEPSHIWDLFLGNKGGCIGEVSILLLMLCGLFLIYRKVITWHIPVSYVGTVALITFLSPQYSYSRLDYMLAHLVSGSLILGAFFMATDYSTSPVTAKGRIIYGIGCGLITVVIRKYGGYPEGVTYAILIMNLFTWFIDKLTRPKRFGTGGAAHVN